MIASMTDEESSTHPSTADEAPRRTQPSPAHAAQASTEAAHNAPAAVRRQQMCGAIGGVAILFMSQLMLQSHLDALQTISLACMGIALSLAVLVYVTLPQAVPAIPGDGMASLLAAAAVSAGFGVVAAILHASKLAGLIFFALGLVLVFAAQWLQRIFASA